MRPKTEIGVGRYVRNLGLAVETWNDSAYQRPASSVARCRATIAMLPRAYTYAAQRLQANLGT